MIDTSSGLPGTVHPRTAPLSLHGLPEAPRRPFAVQQVLSRGAHVRVVVHGEADCAVAAELARTVHTAMDAARGGLILDLHHTTFIDSSCLRVLLGAKTAADAAGVGFRLRYRQNGPVHRLLRLCCVEEYFATSERA